MPERDPREPPSDPDPSGEDAERDAETGLLKLVQRWLGVLALAALASRLIFGIGRWRLTIVLSLLFLGWTLLARTIRGFVRGLLGDEDEPAES